MSSRSRSFAKYGQFLTKGDTNMIVKSIVLAAVVFFGSITITEAQSFVNGGVAGPNTALGWNYGYIAFCQVVSDGVTSVFYAFFEGGGYAFTTNPGFLTLAGPACQTGNVAGIHVTRLVPFQWNSIVTFSFR
jgi:hypothetical protein